MQVVVKEKHTGFYEGSSGMVGTVEELDEGSYFDVKVKWDCVSPSGNNYEWGNADGIRKLKQGEKPTKKYTQPEKHTDLQFGQIVLVNNDDFENAKAEVRGIEPEECEDSLKVLVKIGEQTSGHWVSHHDILVEKTEQ